MKEDTDKWNLTLGCLIDCYLSNPVRWEFSWNFLSLTQSLPAVSQAHQDNKIIRMKMTVLVMIRPASTLLIEVDNSGPLSDNH